ncbi:MAG: CPBP family intramembrane glutamic endopeptidase [Vicinamibacterales bacterium]
MDETQALLPAAVAPAAPTTLAASTTALPRWAAGLEALLVCGIPTQVVIATVLVFAANVPLLDNDGHVSLEFFSTLSLIDTAVVALLIRVFLWLSAEDPVAVFVGARPVRGELLRGLALVPVVILAVTGIVLGLRTVAPWTHTVTQNPLEAFMQTPFEAGIFMFVVMLAGGVREELQRAFILHRFEQRLGGVRVGLAVFSVTFGVLHLEQGLDVAVAVGLLGLLWGVLYVKRRSVVLPMVNHATFNALQVLQGVLLRSFGG